MWDKKLNYLRPQNKKYIESDLFATAFSSIWIFFFKYSFEMKSNERWISSTKKTIYKIDGRKDRRRAPTHFHSEEY